MMQIKLPTQIMDVINEDLDRIDCLVFIGANGSGKTRLADWIERNNANIYRISAHKNLSIEDPIKLVHLTEAHNLVRHGNIQYSQHNTTTKNSSISGDRSDFTVWGLYDDFANILALLIAQDREYTYSCLDILKNNGSVSDNSPIEIVKTIFNNVRFPKQDKRIDYNRQAGLFEIIENNRGNKYSARKMSDGERAILYYIAYCVSIENETIIIVDEPEVYLHKSIVKKLWDEIERFCINKSFIYLTHDLDFAISRTNCKKIWIKEYLHNNTIWEAVNIEQNVDIEEKMMLTILGSRQDVLFLEGKDDMQLYNAFYKDFLVITVGGCGSVIRLTKAFNDASCNKLHNKKVFGIIDKDYRSDEECKELQQDHIYAIELHELESIYCSEQIVKVMIRNLYSGDPDEKLKNIKREIFQHFTLKQQELINKFTLDMCKYQLKNKINTITITDITERNISTFIPLPEIEKIVSDTINLIAESGNFNELLKIYKGKDIGHKIALQLGLSSYKYYKDAVHQQIKKGEIKFSDLENFLPILRVKDYL